MADNNVVEKMTELLESFKAEFQLYGLMATAASLHGMLKQLEGRNQEEVDIPQLIGILNYFIQQIANMGGVEFTNDFTHNLELAWTLRQPEESESEPETSFEISEEDWSEFLGNMGVGNE